MTSSVLVFPPLNFDAEPSESAKGPGPPEWNTSRSGREVAAACVEQREAQIVVFEHFDVLGEFRLLEGWLALYVRETDV